MKTSVRNQWLGTVRTVKAGAVNAEAVLALRGGDEIVAQVTMDSVKALGLSAGSEAWVLVKSSWISLFTGADAPRISARNRILGTVRAIRAGSVNAEVSLELSGGEIVTSVVTQESVQHLDLIEGMPAWAVFKANAVILAVN
jgi:molybdate transport system regulatory protein